MFASARSAVPRAMFGADMPAAHWMTKLFTSASRTTAVASTSAAVASTASYSTAEAVSVPSVLVGSKAMYFPDPAATVIVKLSPTMKSTAPSASVKESPPPANAAPTLPIPTTSPAGSVTSNAPAFAAAAVIRREYAPAAAPTPAVMAPITPLPVFAPATADAAPISCFPSTAPAESTPAPDATVICSRERNPFASEAMNSPARKGSVMTLSVAMVLLLDAVHAVVDRPMIELRRSRAARPGAVQMRGVDPGRIPGSRLRGEQQLPRRLQRHAGGDQLRRHRAQPHLPRRIGDRLRLADARVHDRQPRPGRQQPGDQLGMPGRLARLRDHRQLRRLVRVRIGRAIVVIVIIRVRRCRRRLRLVRLRPARAQLRQHRLQCRVPRPDGVRQARA